jgi:hypothetical protein
MQTSAMRGAMCALLWGCAVATAAPVTIVGTDIDLVYDSALLGSFGTPTLVGNSLLFTLNEQRVESANGAGSQVLNSTLSGISLRAKNGFRFGALNLAVFGDYRLSGAGSQVQVGGQLRAFDASQPGAAAMATTVQADAGLPLTINDGSTQNWTGLAHIDGGTAVAGGGINAIAAGVGLVGLEIDLLLAAYTDPTESGLRQAFIENKFSGLMVNIARADPVPLPITSTLALLAPLLLGLGWVRACSDLASRSA